jgi:ABC-2 type transport system ATP-binding protein
MRQRLGIARCLLADPDLLILDEPLNGLDPGGILLFRELLHSLVAEGRTVFLSSHLLDEVEKTCTVAAVIDRGRLIAQGTIDTLLRDARTQLEIGCTPSAEALQILKQHAAVTDAHEIPAGVRATLENSDAVAEITAQLVGAGIAVFRLEPGRESLEHRFLTMTTPVGEPS